MAERGAVALSAPCRSPCFPHPPIRLSFAWHVLARPCLRSAPLLSPFSRPVMQMSRQILSPQRSPRPQPSRRLAGGVSISVRSGAAGPCLLLEWGLDGLPLPAVLSLLRRPCQRFICNCQLAAGSARAPARPRLRQRSPAPPPTRLTCLFWRPVSSGRAPSPPAPSTG